MRSVTGRSARITLSKNSSVSRLKPWRRLSSKSGNKSEFGGHSNVAQLQPLPREVVHDGLRPGIASMRRTCASRTAGSVRRPCSATRSSSSSGTLLQRKNDRREAASTPPRRLGRARRHARRSRSTRNTNRGAARIRWSPASIPASKVACAALVEDAHDALHIRAFTGPRYARCVERGQDLFRATTFDGRGLRWHAKICGGSACRPIPSVEWSGNRERLHMRTSGPVEMSMELRMNGCSLVGFCDGGSSTNATSHRADCDHRHPDTQARVNGVAGVGRLSNSDARSSGPPMS